MYEVCASRTLHFYKNWKLGLKMGVTEENNKKIRLNKFLSQAGFCSRRKADSLIEEGRVTVNGKIAYMGDKVLTSDEVRVSGKLIGMNSSTVILLFNKPKGLVCTTAGFDKRNIIDYLKLDYRVFPIGRLDKDSHGLLLLTNNGEIVNKILKSGNYHEKEYIVRVNRKVNQEFLKQMSKGVHIADKEKGIDTVTKTCKCERMDDFHFKIILTQGINRQIRRMCEALDYKVLDLQRVRIMNIRLKDLKVGEYRKLNRSELDKLMKVLEKSRN